VNSLKERYFYKVLTGSTGILFTAASQMIIVRGLGPKTYGDFTFLTGFFGQVIGFLDMGTSIGFYTKLSQRQVEFKLVKFYFCFMTAVFLIIMSGVAFAHIYSFSGYLWPQQEINYIYLAAVYGTLFWATQILSQMIDAYGMTVIGEKIRIVQRGAALVLISLLYFLHLLNLESLFYYHYLVMGVGGYFLVSWIIQHDYLKAKGCRISRVEATNYMREFYRYSHPLFTYSLLAMLVGIFDKWLLQRFGGSIQQGFYGLSYQIGAICFLSASAMTPLLLREFSIAYGNRDMKQIAVLFRRYIPLLYSITAYFSCFIVVQADNVINLFGGEKYREAAVAVAIMALFPIHQTYGQMSSSVFYATGQTRLFRNISVLTMIFSLPITYFLIAPPEHLGIGAGAIGLAVKMVLVQFVDVNIALYFNTKFLKLSFLKYFGHQLLNVTCLLAAALVATACATYIVSPQESRILNFTMSGVLYTGVAIAITFLVPAVFGLREGDVRALLNTLRGKA
jgi:O-antigen/teichoic acid export membrane protein